MYIALQVETLQILERFVNDENDSINCYMDCSCQHVQKALSFNQPFSIAFASSLRTGLTFVFASIAQLSVV